MVNIDPKKEIHHCLMNARSWLSGETLSEHLSISRVAVWKHLQKMKESGYPLLSSNRGYRLDSAEDTLAPWALELGERQIRHFASTTSTMDEARSLAEAGTPAGTIVLAEEQTSGRGRLGRKWDSKAGGLYFTIIEYPKCPLKHVYEMNKSAVLAVMEFLNHEFDFRVRIREPNDLWTREGKIAGVLLEVSGEIERIRYCTLGFGLNVRNFADRRGGTSLTAMTGNFLKRRDLLRGFLPWYEKNLNLNKMEIDAKWRENLQMNFNDKE